MKKSLLFLMLTLMGLTMMAKPVDPDRAVLIAKNFVSQYVKGADQMTATVVYTHPMQGERSKVRGENGERPAMYVVNIGNMFVIVAADDVAHPVLGYSLSRPWPVQTENGKKKNENEERSSLITQRSSLPPQVASYLDDLANQIESAVGQQSVPDRETTTEWHQLTTEHLTLNTNLPDSVGPLLTTTWDQGQYYNALCPADANGPDGHALTGCVATAMAQIINYWGYPVHGRGTHSYETSYGTLTVNYDSANYDYANMPNVLTATSTPAQVNAVAKLMYDCGVAANMNYSSVESGTYYFDARAGLINFFRFSPYLSYAEKSYFSNEDWQDLLRENIAASHPVIYGGQGDAGGHGFVCDGYKAGGYFHFNFGWSGSADGWYLTSAVNPIGMPFNSGQSAIFGIVPDSNGNIILSQMTGSSIFVVTEPIEMSHLMGYNKYTLHINTIIPYQSNISFIPNEATGQLEAEMVSHFDQIVTVYDGDRINNSLLMEFEGGWNSLITSVVSTNSALTVVNNGIVMNDGFRLNIQNQGDCPSVSNITTYTVSDSVNLSWTENGTATQWQVEYGPSGFRHGEGTLITVYDTMVNIGGLFFLTQYDFAIRPICNTDEYGSWKTISILSSAPYWSDIVIAEPDSYNFESDSIVLISSAEDFTWWAKTGCAYNAKLTNDIDLGRYKWLPVNLLSKKLDGQGHKIINLYTKEEYTSLFIDVRDTICNLGLEKFRVISTLYDAGALCYGLYSSGVIYNCYVVDGYVEGFSRAGGMVNSVAGGKIINCYAEATLMGRTLDAWKGIIAGENSLGGEIRNCYAICPAVMRNRWNAGVVGYSTDATILNCYSTKTPSGFVGIQGAIVIEDTSTFSGRDLDWTLHSPIAFDDEQVSDLCTALNRGVSEINNENLKVWLPDSNFTNGGYPILGDPYTVTCPNVSDISIKNIKVGDSIAAVIGWTENGDATQWQIKYRRHNTISDTAVIVTTTHNPDTLYGIPPTFEYDFYVRAKCNQADFSGWGNAVSEIVDLPYWTDIVTNQPEDFVMDVNGNVTINSAEGLAWLSAISNGNESYQINNVYITNDIDLGGYRWYPIAASGFHVFSGNFNGNGHKITNIYINGKNYAAGLFGQFDGEILQNVIMEGGQINNHTVDQSTNYASGGLVGRMAGNIKNCHSSVNVNGYSKVGGLCGYICPSYFSSISAINCSSNGNVMGLKDYGGLFGYVYGNVSVRNCYTTGNVLLRENVDESGQWGAGGLIGGIQFASISNCYSSGELEYIAYPNLLVSNCVGNVIGLPDPSSYINNIYGLSYEGSLNFVGGDYGYYTDYIQDTSSFYMDGDFCTLTNAITIDNSSYTDLISALNAWIDANDTAGVYRHWAADSANTNRGFPVFAAMPCMTVIYCDNITACNSYTWHGNTYTTSTTLIDTLSTIGGCDSIVIHNLTVNYSNNSSSFVIVCESYSWNDVLYTTSGSYTYSLLDDNGCTQVDTLHLIINNPMHTSFIETACDSYTWIDGNTYRVSGSYTYSQPDNNYCTQVDTLHLTVNYSNTGVETVTACDSYTWHGTTYPASNNTATFTETNAAGCDSMVTLNLMVNYSNTGTENVTACDNYTWHGTNYTASNNTATFTEINAAGCDSVVTLNLTVNYSNTGIENVTACDNYTWHGTTYTASNNTSTFTETSAAGCDSVVTLNLTVNHSNTGVEIVTACDSYTWHGTAYTASNNTATFTTTNSVGCDSVTTLTLTVNYSNTGVETVTACDSYTWIDGNTYTVSTQNPTFTIQNSFGCDSVVTLNLTVNHSAETIVTDSAETSYTWHGITFTESGIYPWINKTTEDCDSTETLNLTITNPSQGQWGWNQSTACPGWNNPANFTVGSTRGSYSGHAVNISSNDKPCPNPLTGNTGVSSMGSTYLASQLAGVTSTGSTCSNIPEQHNQYRVMTELNAYDPNTGYNLPYVPTHFNTHDTTPGTINTMLTRSIRIGDGCSAGGNNDGESGAALYYTMQVTPDNAMMILYYALVSQASTHGQQGNPTFVIRVMKQNFPSSNYWVPVSDTMAYYMSLTPSGTSQDNTCPNMGYITLADSGQIGWHQHGNVLYKDWERVSIDLTYYMYQTLQIQVMIYDDIDNERYAYGYIDGECRPMRVSQSGCQAGTSTNVTVLSAPQGMTNYVWYASEFGAVDPSSAPMFEPGGMYDFVTWRPLTDTTTSPSRYLYPVQASDFLVTRQRVNETTDTVNTISNRQTFRCEITSAIDPNKPYKTYLYTTVQNLKPVMDVDSPMLCDGTARLQNRSYVPGDSWGVVNDSTRWWFYDNANCTGTPVATFIGDSASYHYEGNDLRGVRVRTLTYDSTCYSEAIYTLHPYHGSTSDTTAVACESYTWHNNTYLASGTPTYSATNAEGCDSTVTLNLTINNPVPIATTETACETYTWNGTAYTANGNYTYTLLDSNGCTQVDTLHLTINHNSSGTETTSACDSYTWIDGNTYTASTQNSTFTIQNSFGCDSTVTLHLTVNYSSTATDTATACDSYTWIDGNIYTSSTQNSTFTTLNSHGCDSTVTLHLTLNYSSTGDTSTVACESYTWQGSTYTISGDITGIIPLQNTVGCDSIVTLHLTISNPIHAATNETACETYTWNGTPYTASGNYTYSHLDANGCTQVDTLHLTINYSNAVNETDTACENYFFGGEWISVSGQYIDSLTNIAGCDSIVTLNLTINNPVHVAITKVACDSYTWQGATLTVSGDYTYPHDDANGCTQVDTLHLTINYGAETTVTDTAEDSYTWQGTTYTESGTYQWVGTTAEGCDSTVTLILTITTSQEGIDESGVTLVRLTVTDGRIIVDEAGGQRSEVRVYDVMGRQYPPFTSHISPFTLSNGVYLVKIGDYPARRVVVIR